MRRHWKQLFLVPLLAVAVFGGCEFADRGPAPLPTAPSEPQELLGGLLGGNKVQGYTLVREPLLPDLKDLLKVSSLIGVEGGQLTLLGHTLVVPKGAVSKPTLFSLIVLPTGYVEVDLSATVSGLLGLVLDVGGQGFAEPVPVTLTYSRATNVTDPSRLQILHAKGLLGYRTLVPVPSRVDPVSKTVTAELEHFSRYVLAMP